MTTTYNQAGIPVSSSDGTAYVHDAVGTLTGVTGPDPDWTYGYNSWGRMTSAQGGSVLAYSYDALNRLTTRTQGSTTIMYRYIGNTEDPVSVTEAGIETRCAYTPSGPLVQKTGANVRVQIPDLHEDVVGLADLSGSVVGTRAYSPWGEPRATSGEEGLLGFQGGLTEPSTGLVEMGSRLYHPALGRFTSRDVLFGDSERPTSLNQYVYGWDNPISLIDPDGMKPRKPRRAGGGRLGFKKTRQTAQVRKVPPGNTRTPWDCGRGSHKPHESSHRPGYLNAISYTRCKDAPPPDVVWTIEQQLYLVLAWNPDLPLGPKKTSQCRFGHPVNMKPNADLPDCGPFEMRAFINRPCPLGVLQEYKVEAYHELRDPRTGERYGINSAARREEYCQGQI